MNVHKLNEHLGKNEQWTHDFKYYESVVILSVPLYGVLFSDLPTQHLLH